MRKKRTTFLMGILLLIIIAAGVGLYKFNQQHTNVENDDADAELNAVALYNQYATNETAADSLYLNKVLSVKGEVVSKKHESNNYFIQLKGSETGNGINCQMMMNDTAMLQNINQKQLITIKGRCSGFLADVNLVDCVITK